MKTEIVQNKKIINNILKNGRKMSDVPKEYTEPRMVSTLISDGICVVDTTDNTLVSYYGHFEKIGNKYKVKLHNGEDETSTINDINLLWMYSKDAI